MAHDILAFGEHREEFPVPVLNERAVRASAGLLFAGALVSFMNAWLVGNFQPTRVFVLAFLIDFTVRLFVNPRFSPSFIVGSWMVRRQRPEWVGAPQKRFAWAIGFGLACVMTYLVVIEGVVGPANMLVCGACLLLMFFETAFGICLGCKVYNLFNATKARLCPGAACEADIPPGERIGAGQVVALLAFAVAVYAAGSWVAAHDPYAARHAAPAASSAGADPVADAAEAARCKVPDFARAIGHEEMWKLHNNCR
jgi:hypothetical protein